MDLPGGLRVEGRVERRVTLAAVDGHVERLLAARDLPGSLPERVTALLAHAVATIGGRLFNGEAARALCVADRRWLVRSVLVALGEGTDWTTRVCGGCGEAFDVLVDQGELLSSSVDSESPPEEGRVRVDSDEYLVRAPVGEDEEIAARAGDPLSALLDACARPLRSGGRPASRLSPTEAALIEDAVEGLLPAVPTEIATACPACGQAARIGCDPYERVGCGDGRLVREVHALARAYHWSESEILGLPASRRRTYLQLVDRERGFVT